VNFARNPALPCARQQLLKGGEITLIPYGDTYIARAKFMPLALLADNKCSCAGAQRGLNTATPLKFERRIVA